MTDINLFKLEGKPLEKLIDVISKGIGTIYRPRAIRKEAEAKAYRIEIIERARAKAIAEGKEIETETLAIIQEKIIAKEQKRLNNIDNVANIAALEIKDEPSISEDPVNEDWATRFFNIIEDISDDEMQLLWGKVLAGEIKRPKSFSLRTLEFLKNLSKEEAQSFMKVAGLSLFGGGKKIVFNPENGKFLEDNYKIFFTDLLQLKELGLINTDPNLVLKIAKPEKDETSYLTYINKAIVIERKVGAPELSIPTLVFTQVAMELLKLVQQEPDMIYIRQIKKHLTQEFVTVKIGDILRSESDKAKVINIIEI
jgi:hypothetical protein